MLFVHGPRRLVVFTLVVAAIYAQQFLAWSERTKEVNGSFNMGEGALLFLWALGMGFFLRVYVRWLQKHFYYHKLMWLFEHRLADKQVLKYVTRDGMTHTFSANGSFYKVVTTDRKNRVVRTFRFEFGRVNVEIPTMSVHQEGLWGTIGNRMLFNQRMAFKDLSNGLSAAYRP